jgi:hypothetical protein
MRRAARRSAAAASALAGEALRVWQLRGECAALPQRAAVLSSFSVPEPLLADAQPCVRAWRVLSYASGVTRALRCRCLDAYLQTARVAHAESGATWTSLALTSEAQASHAVVL